MDYMVLGTFLSGAMMTACIVAGMFFLRFYKQTGDKFFYAFSVAFFMMGLERIALLLYKNEPEEQTYVYLLRLVAFLVIIFAILVKNRPRSP